jgi:hypothetical protein
LTEFINTTSVLALAASVSAIAALITAYLNYRSRPVLMRSVERHSEDLRKIVMDWAKQIPEAKRPEEVGSSLLKPEDVHIAIEDEFLFLDVANHIPAEIPVIRTWTEYKAHLNAYDQTRHQLLLRIQEEISRRTGLQYDSNFQHGITIDAAKAVYQDLFAEITNGSSYWKQQVMSSKIRQSTSHPNQYELWTGRSGLAAGTEAELTNARSILGQMLNLKEDADETLYAKWKDTAKNLPEEKKALDKGRDQLLREVNNLSSVPIFPGECKYIKWSLTKR